MNDTMELTVLKLMLSSTLFTKCILILLFSLSILSWAIMLNKYLFVNSYKSAISKFFALVTNQRNSKYIEDCCAQHSKGIIRTVPVIMLKLIRASNQGRGVLSPETIINNAIMHEVSKLQRWMAMLATTASASPLIGLLGTVWGIMNSFISINKMGNASIATVAPGIAEALMTTIAGLCVAIPAMAGHNFLSIRINSCIDQLERIDQFTHDIFSRDFEE